MKKQVPVEQLSFGVYIHELDRPWTETPFMFQGFVLDNEKQLETLKKYCQKVVIDTEKSSDASDRPSVLTTIREKVVYEDKAPFQVELPVARQVQAKASVVMKDIVGAIKGGQALDAPRVSDAVTSITDSVMRNPDAMLLLARMKEKAEHAFDRAFGVSVYMITFGRFLQLPRGQIDLLGMLGLLQDVGKVRLPEELLNKNGPLNESELEVCKSHVQHSVAILKESVGFPAELPALAALHHERYDGSGYPAGLKGGEIGLFGSIAGVIDCFDALTEPRPYSKAMSPSNALSMLHGLRGTQFDGPLVEQFIQCIGIYPVGTLVELNSGEIGIVITRNPALRLRPRVMVVIDAKGNPIKPPLILDLAKDPKVDPETPYRINRTLEKGSVPIDASEFFI